MKKEFLETIKSKKKNLVSLVFTSLIILVLIFSGPAKAIDVNLYLPSQIDLSDAVTPISFSVDIKINDNEFLPILHTLVTFDNSKEKTICKINKDNIVENCDFLKLIYVYNSNLYADQKYGYGYGYNPTGELDYHQFGYGYGYGAGGGPGFLTYSFLIDPIRVPPQFVDASVSVKAKVYGGTEDNYNYFVGKGSFNVIAPEQQFNITPTLPISINYTEIEIEIPANVLPPAATAIKIDKVALNETYTPPAILTAISNLMEFKLEGTTETVFSAPITIKMPYSQAALDAANGNAANLRPYYFNTATNSWQNDGLTFANVDTVNQKVEFTTNHFTVFAVFLVSSVTSTNPAGSPSGNSVSTVNYKPSDEEEVIPEPVQKTVAAPEAEQPSTPTPTTETPQGLAGITGQAVAALKNNKPLAAVMSVIAMAALALLGSALFGKGGFGKGLRNAIKGNKSLEKAKVNLFFFLFMHFNYIPRSLKR